LGLAVVHGIIRRHLGAITVHSEPEKGTTFHIYLPRHEGKIKVESAALAPIPRGTERVLFVDDEEALAVIGQKLLTQLGYEALAKTSSVDALETFRGQPDHFDLVITDYTMPKLTGAELASEILKIRADVPIILCTGFSERIDEEKAKRLGISEFVMKPFTLRTLAELSRRALDKGKR
jgi:two-component system cell cycle sensor histidine kinase/response regulator CckA